MSVLQNFVSLCAEYAYEQVDNQRDQFKRLGVRGDWDNPYITLTTDYEAAQIKVFGEMAKKGYIYKGLKPVYWSPSSESALAEAEIEYYDKRSPSIYVAFDVKDGKGVLETDDKIVIWTTTPWTIPANLGICLHPELEYVVVKVNGEKYVSCTSIIRIGSGRIRMGKSIKLLKSSKVKKLDRIVARHPFYDRDSLVMLR